MSGPGRLVKGVLDRLLALLGLVVLSPLLLVVAALVRLSLGRLILFRQQRPGLHGRPFELLKFRTMRGGGGPDEKRLTLVGRFLRAWSLDELPELWNAQVNGRNALSWDEKFDLDVWYVDNWSLWLDVCILGRTFWQVLRREGISHEGHATMTEFIGSSEEAKRPDGSSS